MVGVSAALLALGTRTVVSSVVHVVDRHTKGAMLAFHQALRNGDGPARALRLASPQLWEQEPAAVASHGAFVVIGAGRHRPGPAAETLRF